MQHAGCVSVHGQRVLHDEHLWGQKSSSSTPKPREVFPTFMIDDGVVIASHSSIRFIQREYFVMSLTVNLHPDH